MIKREQITHIFDSKKIHDSKLLIQIGITFLLMVILLISFKTYNNSRNRIHDLPGIIKSGRLSVLTDSSSTGFSIKNDSIFGFQYEIVKAFADSLGIELVISEQNDLKTGIQELKNGDYDIIASFIPITTELKKDASFTIPLITSRQVLVQRLNTDSVQKKHITKHSQLANDTIYIPENSPFKMRLVHLSDEIASPIYIIEMKNINPEQIAHLVAIGKIKYTICDEQIAQKLKKIYPILDVSIPIGFAQQEAWIVNPKSKKLLQKLNEFLNDFIGSSAYWTLYQKYY